MNDNEQQQEQNLFNNEDNDEGRGSGVGAAEGGREGGGGAISDMASPPPSVEANNDNTTIRHENNNNGNNNINNPLVEDDNTTNMAASATAAAGIAADDHPVVVVTTVAENEEVEEEEDSMALNNNSNNNTSSTIMSNQPDDTGSDDPPAGATTTTATTTSNNNDTTTQQQRQQQRRRRTPTLTISAAGGLPPRPINIGNGILRTTRRMAATPNNNNNIAGNNNTPPPGLIPIERLQTPPGRQVLRVPRRVGQGRISIQHNGQPFPQPLNTVWNTPIKDLQDTVLPDSQQELRGGEDRQQPSSGQQDEETWHCGICMEYIEGTPVGCGQCSGRYCAPCLQAYVHRDNGNRGVGRNQQKQCPVCRGTFAIPQPDHELRNQLDSHYLPCRYATCPEQQKIALSQHKQHEANCPGVLVACKYQPYGCTWKGRRGESRHDCPLSKIPTLLEQHRLLHVHHHRDVTHLTQQIGALVHSLHVQDRGLRAILEYNVSNPLHVLQFVTNAVLSTPDIIRQCHSWKPLYQTPEARSRVFNFLLLLPTFLVVFQRVFRGLFRTMHYLDMLIITGGSSSETIIGVGDAAGAVNDTWDPNQGISEQQCMAEERSLNVVDKILDELLWTILVGMLGVLIIMFIFKEQQTGPRRFGLMEIGPRRWNGRFRFQIPYEIIVGLSFALLYALMASESMLLSLWVFKASTVASLLFATVIFRISVAMAADNGGDPVAFFTVTGILSQHRISRPLLTGMRYGVACYRFQLLHLLDGVACAMGIKSLLSRTKLPACFSKFWNFPESEDLVKKNILRASDFQVYFFMRAAIAIFGWHQHGWDDGVWRFFWQSLGVALISRSTVALYIELAKAGYSLGGKIYTDGKLLATRAPSSGQCDCVGLGVFAFGLWTASLLLIVAL